MVETAVVVAAGERDSRQLVAYVVPKAEADLWDVSDPALIHDPVERMAFTLRQPGLPARPIGTVTLALPGGTFDEARRAAFLARQSYRRFAGPRLTIGTLAAWLGAMTTGEGPLPGEARAPSPAGSLTREGLGHWLAHLQAMPVEGALLTKRLYPSAGGLYLSVCTLISRRSARWVSSLVYMSTTPRITA